MKSIFRIAIIVFVVSASLFAEPYQSDDFLLPGWSIATGMGGMRIVQNWDGLTAAANPALLTEINNFSAAVSGGSYFESLITSARGGVVFSGDKMRYGVALSHIGGDGIQLTNLQNPDAPLSADNRPIVTGEVSHYTVSADVAAAKTISSEKRISIGLSAKGVRKSIPDVSAWGFSLSAGALWRPIQNFDIAAFAENLSTYQLFWSDGVSETGLPKLGAGAMYEMKIYGAISVAVGAESGYSLDDGIGDIRAGAVGKYGDIISFAIGTSGGALCSGAEINFSNFKLGAAIDYRSLLGTSYSFSLGYSPRIAE